MHDVGIGQAEGTVHRCGIGYDNTPYAQFPGKGARQDGAGAAERMQDEIPRVQALLDGDLVDQVGDLCASHAEYTDCRLFHGQAQRFRDLLPEQPDRVSYIQAHGAVEKSMRVDITEQQQHVGDGGLGPAEPVTDGPGRRPGALRPHQGRRGILLQGDQAAAACADGGHVDFRYRVVEPVNHGFPGILNLTVLDYPHLEGGAAHVRGDDVPVSHAVAENLAADDPGNRAAFHHVHRPPGGMFGRQQAAVALHDQYRSPVIELAQQPLQVVDVVADHLSGIGVDHGGRGALIFARERRYLAG